MDELVIGDQKYISSKRAAIITGYAKDYIGQLCREGRVEARLVGRSWYVREAAIRDHRFKPENEPVEPVKVEPPQDTAMIKTWDIPKYEAVIAPEIPIHKEMEEEAIELPTYEAPADTATQMQAAWQAWFSQNRREEAPAMPQTDVVEEKVELEEAVESAQVEPEPEIEEETPVMIRKVESAEEGELAPKADFEPLRIERVKSTHSNQPSVGSSYFAVRIALIVVAALSISMVSLGLGLVPDFGNGGVASAINALSGTKAVSK